MSLYKEVHPEFKLNGLSYTQADDLLQFAVELKAQGAPHEVQLANFLNEWFDNQSFILATTSGSTGEPKQMRLAKSAMIQSARTTGKALELGAGTEALLCLSPNFIAGKMMAVRALTLGWHLHVVAPSMEALTEYDSQYDFAALVPAQATSSLTALEKVGTVLIGGGAVSPSLEANLKEIDTRAFASYGMTETVSHIALRRLNGKEASNYYTAVDGVTLHLDERGCLVITAPGLSEEDVVTNDLVNLLDDGQFEWLGRIDNVINSGGIKIHPESIETQLSDRLEAPFFIASEPDEVLGERLILIVESPTSDGRASGVSRDLFNDLPKYSRPKMIYGISKFLYTETGKIRRQEILSLIKNYQANN